MKKHETEAIIIGGGPAGLTAGLYLSRARVKTLLFEKTAVGGQVLLTDSIENFPGFEEGVSGYGLIEKIRNQAVKFGLEILSEEAVKISQAPGGMKAVETAGGEYHAPGLIYAGGARPKKTGLSGEGEFAGRGVSYCAVCDGAFFRGQPVAVIGGGDRAAEEAIFLTRFASRVLLVHRRNRLRATKILQERVLSDSRIQFIPDSTVSAISGSGRVEKITVKNNGTGLQEELPVNAVFVAIGFIPETEPVAGLLKLDENGYILTDERMETSARGIFACGDCRKKEFRQIVTACGDGASAAFSLQKHIEEIKGIEYK